MKQLTIFLIILFYSNVSSQDIKWNTVTKNEYNPVQLISRGVVTLEMEIKHLKPIYILILQVKQFFTEILSIMRYIAFTKRILNQYL